MQGKYVHDINDLQQGHVLRALLAEELLGAGAAVHQYAGFKRIEPGMDIGVELGEEWGMAERLVEAEGNI